MRRRWGLALAGLVVVVVGSRLLSRTRFDSVRWQDEGVTNRKPYPRLQMADDLLRRHILDGLPADSVEALLGPKPKTDYFAARDYVYWLGPERGWVRIDSEWLVIDLGVDGRVARAEIVRD